jgi:polar amino acid transport system substrate-binding protein
MNISPEVIRSFSSTGKLRASINVGNPILANRNQATGEPIGVSVDLAREFATRLGVELELVVFESAGESVKAVMTEQADIGFFAIDPLRGEEIAFTAPYVLIEGNYLVREDSSIQSNEDVDKADHRVVVGKGSAYDLFLTRELRFAQILRAATSPAVVEFFLDQKLEVAAGVRQQLEADAAHRPGLRLLPQAFMIIRQAMGLPKSRGPAAAATLAEYVEEMKAQDFVLHALARHGIRGAAVAPAAVV